MQVIQKLQAAYFGSIYRPKLRTIQYSSQFPTCYVFFVYNTIYTLYYNDKSYGTLIRPLNYDKFYSHTIS